MDNLSQWGHVLTALRPARCAVVLNLHSCVTVEEVGMVWESDFGKTFPNFKRVPWFVV